MPVIDRTDSSSLIPIDQNFIPVKESSLKNTEIPRIFFRSIQEHVDLDDTDSKAILKEMLNQSVDKIPNNIASVFDDYVTGRGRSTPLKEQILEWTADMLNESDREGLNKNPSSKDSV